MKKIIVIIPVVILAFGLNFFQISDYNIRSQKETSNHSVYSHQVIERECSFCHNDKLKYKVMHAPVADDCETCHQTTGEKHPRSKIQGFTLAEKTPDLCYICHEPKNDKKNIHAPINEGCSSCHSPHGSDYQFLLSEPTTQLVCAECHNLNFKENKNIHAAIESDGCQSCHDSHQSDYSYLLIEEKSTLCFTCHDDIATEKQEKYIHAPFEDDCSNCHNPHNSKEEHLLNMPSSELCFSCHDDIGNKVKKSKHTHGIINSKNTCQNCHDPHASSHQKLLLKEQDDLCFNCHDEEIKTESKTIENIKQTIQESKYKHAAMEGGCNTCHDPHASDNNSLLVGAFSENEYEKVAVETFGLCFNCHDSDLLEKEFSKTATNFRNQDKNLHFVHTAGDKGRNCNICHDMHASKNKYLIRKRVQYGSWEMPMNFLLKENGASCRTGCHTEKEYSRKIAIQSPDTITINEKTDTSFVTADIIEKNIPDSLPKNGVTENVAADTLIKNTIQTKPDSLFLIAATDSAVLFRDTVIVEEIIDNKQTEVSDTPIVEEPNKNNEENSVDIVKNKIEEIIPDTVDNIEENNLPNKGSLSAINAFVEISQLRIFFKFDSKNIAPNANEDIQKLIVFMNQYSDVTIEINGHTDNIGAESYNLDLSKKRANAVKKMLTAKGILPKRIIIKGNGENHPIDSNKTEEGRANNRRVEFKLLTN